jgi:hypothetical protein
MPYVCTMGLINDQSINKLIKSTNQQTEGELDKKKKFWQLFFCNDFLAKFSDLNLGDYFNQLMFFFYGNYFFDFQCRLI